MKSSKGESTMSMNQKRKALCRTLPFRISFLLILISMMLTGSTVTAAIAVLPKTSLQLRDSDIFVVRTYSAGRIQICRKRNHSEHVAVRPCDQIWLVNARNIECQPYDLSQVGVSRFEQDHWINSSLDQLTYAHRTEPNLETVFFVHGYNTDVQWSVTRSMEAYRNLFACNPDRPGIRFVILQWRSEKVALRFRRDYEDKAQLAETTGKTLASILDCFHNQDITVVGYSLGTQVALSAIQELPGGYCANCVSGERYRLVLIAPTLSATFARQFICGPGRSRSVDATLIFKNHNDRVLKIAEGFARRQSRNNYVSLEELFNSSFADIFNVRRFNITYEVVRKHSLDEYTQSPTMQTQFAALLTASSIANTMQPNAMYPNAGPSNAGSGFGPSGQFPAGNSVLTEPGEWNAAYPEIPGYSYPSSVPATDSGSIFIDE